jgi:subtilisin family serine protease
MNQVFRRTRVVALAALLLATGLLSAPVTATAAPPPPTTPVVEAAVDQDIRANGAADFIVRFREQPDLSSAASIGDWTERGQRVVDLLRGTADTSQRELRAKLSDAGVTFTPFWATNAIAVNGGDKAALDIVRGAPEVAEVVPSGRHEIAEPAADGPAPAATDVAWNVQAIKAPQVWQELGTRGEGAVIGTIDTGVDYTHPALAGAYRGNNGGGGYDHNYNWFDPTRRCGVPSTKPCDDDGHGTHTMGTMVGDGGPGNHIGVAPGARWIAAKGCAGAYCYDFALIASGQWMLAPTNLAGADPRPDLRPNVVNNSWGSMFSATGFYRDIVRAWRAAGIFPVFSNGNEGPRCGSTGSPADLPEAYSVGSSDAAGAPSWFSSRGRSNYGSTKPDVTAPGSAVRSALPGGAYGVLSGTSMAAPHVTATVALAVSAAPALAGDLDKITKVLDGGATDRADLSCAGTSGDNNVWGEGALNAYETVRRAPRGPSGVLSGTVTDRGTGLPVAGAAVAVDGATFDRTVSTDASGKYQTRVPAGGYTVTATSYAYRTVSKRTTVGSTGAALDLALRVQENYQQVTGRAQTRDGTPVAGALVSIANSPVPATTTDGDGRFTFESVPRGTHRFVVTPAEGCLKPTPVEVSVRDAEDEVRLTVDRRTDDFGHTCDVVAADYRPIVGVPLNVTGDWDRTKVELPFPVPFYGNVYTDAWLGVDGVLGFQHTGVEGHGLLGEYVSWHSEIPTGRLPNAAIYPYFADLVIDGQAAMYTETRGTAPNRQFVVEWRNASVLEAGVDQRVDVQALISEDGTVTVQYRGLVRPAVAGAVATVGVESAEGTDGLQYSHLTPTLRDTEAIRINQPAGGTTTGVVTDGNDKQPVSGAKVEAVDGAGTVLATTFTRWDGRYWLWLPPGRHTVRVAASDYTAATKRVTVADGATREAPFELATAALTVTEPTVDRTVLANESRSVPVRLTNTGRKDLKWTIREAAGQVLGGARATGAPAPAQVLSSWHADGLGLPATDVADLGDRVWVAGYNTGARANNLEYTPTGAATGRRQSNVVGKDLAWDSRRGQLCQPAVATKSTAGIFCFDPVSGRHTATVTGTGPWMTPNVRGLAYDAAKDVFTVGVNDFSTNSRWTMYRIAGPTQRQPGAVLGECATPGGAALLGLAYDPESDVLWALGDDRTNGTLLYQLDATSCDVLGTVDPPGDQPAGLDVDKNGHLWLTDSATNTVYLVDAGPRRDRFQDVSWLRPGSVSGTLAPGKSITVPVALDAAGLSAGRHLAQLVVRSNAGASPSVAVPVAFTVTDKRIGVDVAGGADYRDPAGDTWTADRAYTAGEYGHVVPGEVLTTRAEIAGTDADPLYRSARVGATGYRFDQLPDGVYELDLRFAEIGGIGPFGRVFDVAAEGEVVLAAVDVAGTAGATDHAADQTVLVRVRDGVLDLELRGLDGYAPPLLSAVRITHRVDVPLTTV